MRNEHLERELEPCIGKPCNISGRDPIMSAESKSRISFLYVSEASFPILALGCLAAALGALSLLDERIKRIELNLACRISILPLNLSSLNQNL
jgi:hypothetical protein